MTTVKHSTHIEAPLPPTRQSNESTDLGPNRYDFNNFDRNKPGFEEAAAKCQKTNSFLTRGGDR